MAVRIHLHTLGDALITVGGKEVRPTSPVVFAALLYFGFERGHRVPRTALQELLFPETGERSGAHSVRQLLYKLRQLGVPLVSRETSLELPADVVSDDFPVAKDIARDDALLARCAAGLLPGYEPRVSPGFGRWLEEQRSHVATRVRAVMLDALARSREAGDHVAMETIALAVLRLDPLNEEATLVRAEVLALTGQKHDAVKVLERYSAEVGVTSPELRIPAEVLRRRIAERFHASDRAAVPMLGRQEDLAFLLAQFARASAGQGTVSVVWGDAGIGKTRLVQEFTSHLVLKNARVESAHCQPFDRERPLGALVDLVPKLLQARGALGVSPESMQQLKRLSGEVPADQPRETNPELTAALIRAAISDLMLCVAAERPLVLLVEDAHWLDEASLRLLLGLVPGQQARLLLVITMRDRPRFPMGTRISESVLVRQLTPLSDQLAADLLTRTLGAGFAVDDSVVQQCVSLAAGNPLFICTVAEHLRLRGAAPSTQAGIADLLKQRIRILDGSTLLLLRMIAALGSHATPDRLRECIGTSLEVELLALQDLADRGLIARQNGSVKCAHDLLTEVVLGDTPPPIRQALYERAATVLESDGTSGKQVQLLWSCAECWRVAGNKDRAHRALITCADFAIEIGQHHFGCLALEKAQELTDGAELVDAVERTVAAAAVCHDHEAVLRNAERHRSLRSLHGVSPARSHEVDLTEINARRWMLEPIWHYADILRSIARDTRAWPETRLRAARMFIISAEQEFKVNEETEFFAELEEDTSLISSAPMAFHHIRLLHHAMFGDLSMVWTCIEEVRRHMNTVTELEKCLILGNVGVAWMRAGHADLAIDAYEEGVRATQRLGLTSLLLNMTAGLSHAYLAIGEHQITREWQEFSAHELQKLGMSHAPGFLSTSLDLALLDGDVDSARGILDVLDTAYRARSTPFNERFALAYDVLIRRLEGRRRATEDLMVPLETLYLRGRQMSEHDFCTVAFGLALEAVGENDRADAVLRDYLTVWRRDRHPVSAVLREITASLRSPASQVLTGTTTRPVDKPDALKGTSRASA